MTFLGLLGNTVGLMVSGGLFVGFLLNLMLAFRRGYADEEMVIWHVLAIVPSGVGFLFFATRFVKLVWAL